MGEFESARVVGRDGLRGTIMRRELPGDSGAVQTAIRLDNGQEIVVPAEALVAQDDGSYYLWISLEELERLRIQSGARPDAPLVVPVFEEQLDIKKRQVEVGRVRVDKIVREREELVDEPLLREEVQVERVAINRVVEHAPQSRQEGDTLIIPILEEVLVVEKRLMLKEELRITRRQIEEHRPEQVMLRSEEVRVSRIDPLEREAGGGKDHA